MTDLRAWIDQRRPSPPMELGPWLEGAAGDDPVTALTDAAMRALNQARGVPGRVRESAFHLLAADALLTYACEAALETADPDTALADILTRAGAGR